jgi:hypothetical protein
MIETSDNLLQFCYAREREYVYQVGKREFDCLIVLVEERVVTTFKELAEYGMDDTL